jgi:ATP-dependent DNA helicase RecG
MYHPSNSLAVVKGVGDAMTEALAAKNIFTIKDLLLLVPLRYEDRSEVVSISQLEPDKLQTFEATVDSVSSFRKGPRTIQPAKVSDQTGSVKLMWFNNKWISQTLKKGQRFRFSGAYNLKYKSISQPTVEQATSQAVHSGRLVPIYSVIPGIQAGKFRRVLKEVIDHLAEIPDLLNEKLSLKQTFQQIHFPDQSDLVITARERLALEELLGLIKHSNLIKHQWQQLQTADSLTFDHDPMESSLAELLPSSIPFQLTSAQTQATKDILADLASSVPMNRLLVGDVGSGKTVVAGIAAFHCLSQGHSVALVAPTQILARQHAATFGKIFPSLPVTLVMAGNNFTLQPEPQIYIGTHALINRFDKIKPILIVYDEQHRFGVNQRSATGDQTITPHTLTMSATPIPRSLMLTIFSHLQLSLLNEMPAGRLPVKTWLTPTDKKPSALTWIGQQLLASQQNQSPATCLVVCPFIETSTTEGFEKIAAVDPTFAQLKSFYQSHFPSLRLAMLHGQMPAKQKEQITTQLFSQEIDLLVTTPVIEVGLDVPTASIIVIHSAERFGMASLHQLRGRVGRAGQQAYCLVMTSQLSQIKSPRLKQFSQINDGLKLAELDLQRRGAGDLFGTQQHGLDNLRFAEWTNLELITKARTHYQQLEKSHPQWQPFLAIPQHQSAQPPAAN